MKTITEFNTKSFLKTSTKLVLLLSFGLFISCEDEIYPEAGSIADKTPPVAAFSASQNEGPEDEWKTVAICKINQLVQQIIVGILEMETHQHPLNQIIHILEKELIQ